MRQLPFFVRRLAGLALVLPLVGCGESAAPEEMKMPPTVVTVSYPVERKVQDYAEFTGRTNAVESVKVRARVYGHLEKINFTEGTEVKAGDVLFVIDQRPYQAALSRAKADLAQNEARAARLKLDSVRGRALLAKDAISREEFDKIEGDLLETAAAARSSEAAYETAKLNLDYTEIRAPISGLISKKYVTVGNLIESPDTGLAPTLTTIVSISPIQAYFDVDDLSVPKIEAVIAHHAGKSGAPVELAVGDERDFPHHGVIDFVDNQVDPGTGTKRMRGLFENKDRVLSPGLFARVRVPLGEPHAAILVADRAIESDQGMKVVYVVTADKTIEKRSVELGGVHDSLRAIVDGIKPGERVVVDGLQRIRPGMTVESKLIEMPTYQDPRRVLAEAAKAKADKTKAAKR
jgi:RND family efflux transporter MFP subunit